jgi:hypothetical protein
MFGKELVCLVGAGIGDVWKELVCLVGAGIGDV